jgi:hypothetical protein
MRIPTYSSVLGFALVAGLIASGVSLVRNLPDSKQYRRWQRDQASTPQPEDNPTATMSHLSRGEDLAARNPSAGGRYFARWRDAVEELLGAAPGYDEWYAAGWARKKTGDDAGARAAWTSAAEALRGSTSADSLYNLARCLALVGDAEGAIVELGHAVDAGWNDRRHTRADRDLDSLHADPRFEALLDRMGPGRPRSGNRLLP